MSSMLTFPSNGGTTGGYFAQPGSGGGAGVIVIQEWWGLNDHIKSVADRLAREGFVALAPDLYHGRVTTSADEAGRLLMDLDIPRAERDLRGAVNHLRALTGKAVGTLGFCMGGALSLFAACKNGQSIGACVVYYGGYRKVEFDFDGLTAPVLGHWAEDDPSVNERLPALTAELKRRGKAHAFRHHAGTKHAFFNDERPSHHPAAAEESWKHDRVSQTALVEEISMSKEKPDHHDADLVLKVYEVRREAVMRESRNAINSQFWPKSYEEALAVTRPDHPLNRAFRQCATYWEMVYGLAKHGIVNADYLIESNTEGLFLFAKVAPHIDRLRIDYIPTAFQHAEWISKECATGRRLMESTTARVRKAYETK